MDELSISCSRGLTGWLAENDCSLAVTSYQSGQLFLIGRDGDNLSVNHSHYPMCMGVAVDGSDLYVATASQIWQLGSTPQEGQFDRFYQPLASHVIGDVDPHEIARVAGHTVFVNSEYSCLAVAETRRVVWQPAWIDRLAPEDRCHLNGIAASGGTVKLATSISRSNVVGGWRDRRAEGGCLIDVDTGEVVASDLSMPHSPRIHEGAIYVLNSGSGHLLRLSPAGIDQVAWMPGFLRGLAMTGRYAVAGISLPRNQLFAGLALDAELTARGADPWCGVQIANIDTGNIEQWVRFNSGVREVFGVALLPGVRSPRAAGLNEKFRVTYSAAA